MMMSLAPFNICVFLLHTDVVKTAGKIPRHEGLMKKKAALKPTTPSNITSHYLHSLYIIYTFWWFPCVRWEKVLQVTGFHLLSRLQETPRGALQQDGVHRFLHAEEEQADGGAEELGDGPEGLLFLSCVCVCVRLLKVQGDDLLMNKEVGLFGNCCVLREMNSLHSFMW